jgi:NAD(P)H-dependent flavin oxidoreductase YrpB (nitropropane dioxygenase family)
MAFICDTPDLCIATTRAGAIGALAGSLLSPVGLASAIDAIRNATDGPFHVNLLAVFPHDPHVDVLVEKRVPIVSFHWGLPEAANMAKLKAAGIAVWAQVGSADAAKAAIAAGCDGIVAQGHEAGGHNYGGLPLMVLLPSIRDVIGDTLLLAAGGIADGRGMAAALALGADAVWVGTRMVATTEANAHPEHHRRLIEANGESTILTGVYGPEAPGFNPMRLIRNATIDTWNDRLAELPAKRDHLDPIGRTRFAGQSVPVRPFDAIVSVPETTGDFDQMPILAGQGVGLIHSVLPAGEVVTTICVSAEAILASLAGALR